MRVLLVTESPDHARQEPESPAEALRDLGCAVTAVGFDLALPDAIRPTVILLDVRERLQTAAGCLAALRAHAHLAETPALLAVTVARLARLDERLADDFVLVPVVPAELYARLRRLDWRLSAFSGGEQLKIDELHVDMAAYEARVRDRRLELTHQEFELLKFLGQNRGRVWTREQLLAKVWGYRYYGGIRTVDIHVRRLRAKMGSPTDALIETVRHVGCKMKG